MSFLLNFAAPPAATESVAKSKKSKAKSGRWTDKLVSKRKEAIKTKKRKASDVGESGGGRPVKRFRPESQSGTEFETDSGDDDAPNKPVPHGGPLLASTTLAVSKGTSSKTTHKQIISSLFSGNAPSEPIAVAKKNVESTLKPSNAPVTQDDFESFGLAPHLLNAVHKRLNISHPTSIQRVAIPGLSSSSEEEETMRDVILRSQTGTGKTVAYTLPILQDLMSLFPPNEGESNSNTEDNPTPLLAIFLTPTKETAASVFHTVRALAPHSNKSRHITPGLLTGGQTREHEKRLLRKGLGIVVGTPGRVLDHLKNTDSLKKGIREADMNWGGVRWIVVDEADRLMDMGFEPQIKEIIEIVQGLSFRGKKWRTVLCSATVEKGLKEFVGSQLKDPLLLQADSQDAKKYKSNDMEEGRPLPPDQLEQKLLVTPAKLRFVCLIAILRSILRQQKSETGGKVLVFFSCTDAVDFFWTALGGLSLNRGSDDSQNKDSEEGDELTENLTKECALLKSTQIVRLHGNLPLDMRIKGLKKFGEETKGHRVLFSTSVAARGLDLGTEAICAVIQYDLPTEDGLTEYVHRIGRTARMGRKGESVTFVLPGKEKEWIDLCSKEMSLGSEESISEVLQTGYGGEDKEEWERRATDVQMAFERWVVASPSNTEYARKAFTSHIRAYSTHPAKEKPYFHVKNLHLGHLAKSFGLREAPGGLGGAMVKSREKEEEKDERRSKDVKSYKLMSLTGREKSEFQIADTEELSAAISSGKLGGKKGKKTKGKR